MLNLNILFLTFFSGAGGSFDRHRGERHAPQGGTAQRWLRQAHGRAQGGTAAAGARRRRAHVAAEARLAAHRRKEVRRAGLKLRRN